MTNVYATPDKKQTKHRLFEIGIETLQEDGYKVERIPGSGKSSVRRITRDGKSQVVAIRTTQGQAIAFPRLEDDKGWRTLDEVNMVVAVSVDDRDNPKNAWVHFLDGDDMRDRFDRTYKARLEAGHKIPVGRGVWLSLYRQESGGNVRLVGAGAGNDSKRVATVPLSRDDSADASRKSNGAGQSQGLTIAEAKRLLAASLGVDEASIKITVEA